MTNLISQCAPGRSFVDIGCMWGINGHMCFLAEQKGAASVTGVDVAEATEAFKKRHRETGSKIRFVHGDFHDPGVQSKIGLIDVVYCSGVLYHVPNPLETLIGLRKICGQTLILATAAIPEMEVRNAAVFWPHLDAAQRRLWDQKIGIQVGITSAYDPSEGYGNWIWGMSPSCIESMLTIAGFSVGERQVSPFGVVFTCRVEETKFAPVSGASQSPHTISFAEARLGKLGRRLWENDAA
ncbi:class I SAM-dependent methyltransferase [Methylobacterium sp. WL12]|uniref:class I SAM-dependent methyltransferase n=1 Tax=Methylobacterium sp. WL12 TaxID=2603890 RepID=UPI0016505C27|nr:class I SAM-dependent methyltransferase [Methylobacterium sp. WL12]